MVARRGSGERWGAAPASPVCKAFHMADEGAFVFDNWMVGYGVELTPERPTDDACERRFMAELGPTPTGSDRPGANIPGARSRTSHRVRSFFKSGTGSQSAARSNTNDFRVAQSGPSIISRSSFTSTGRIPVWRLDIYNTEN